MEKVPINELCKICGKLIKDDIPDGRHYRTHYSDPSGRRHKHCLEKLNNAGRKLKTV